jgi:tetratricopeptide (TPR) repeat protein
MSAIKKSSLLTKYKYLYEKNPRSKVFAPLAETYRKLGMLDEATKILRDGIKLHPTYTLGYIVLGNIYYDEGHYELAYSTIRSFIATNLENIALQKLFGKVCLELNKFDEALDTYKMILFINPKDEDSIENVATLEDKLNYSVVVEDKTVSADSIFDDEDDWVQVDFNKKSIIEDKNDIQVELKRNIEPVVEEKIDADFEIDDDDDDQWSMQSPSEIITDSPIHNNKIDFENIEVKEHDLSSDFFYEDYDNDSDEVITPEDDLLTASTDTGHKIISHTLIDLYYSQGHVDKAISLLKEALVEAPDDEASKIKLKKYQQQLDEEKSIDEMIDKVDTSKIDLKKSYDMFLKLLNDKAKQINDENTYN